MQHDPWARLTPPFPFDALRWRVVEVDSDARSARVVPELAAAAVRDRLDAVLGVAGWSHRYVPFGADAVGCELVIDGVAKSAVVRGPAAHAAADLLAEAALAAAARGFGMVPPVDTEASYWVDYDPEAGEALHAPEARPLGEPPPQAASPGPLPSSDVDESPDADESSGATASDAVGAGAGDETSKTPGQIAIDRLVERLKSEGRGLETARLLVEYGGYPRDPEQARELYGKLRKLLLEAESS